MEKKMTVIVMAVSECNIVCNYCYVTPSRKNVNRIRIEDIDILIRNCSTGFDSVEFCWHGGEPLLAGMPFYQEVLRIQNRERNLRGIVFRNNIQTNGLLLDDAWLDFISGNDFHLGISFDAPPDTNEIHRGVATDRMVEICTHIKKRGIPLGVLCVVTAYNVGMGEEIFRYFSALGVGSYSLLALKHVPLKNGLKAPNNEELYQLYRDTFEVWAGEPSPIRHIDPLETMIEGLLSGCTSLCSFNSSCLERMLTITQDGEVVPCSSLVEDNFVLGNIFAEPLVDMLQGDKTAGFRSLRNESVARYCQKCEFVRICGGGCRADAFWFIGRYEGEYPFCDARRKTFKYLKDRLDLLLNP